MVLTTSYSLCLTRPAPKSRCDSSRGGFPSHANKPSPDATASDFHRASPERMPTARDSPEGSFDLNSNDPDPMPEFDTKGQNHHGTRCAGEIAAVANSVCAVGVAFHAKISGIKILDGPMTDNLEAAAFNKNMHINDVYSCSWGPDDDGKTIDGPHYLARKALLYGVTGGRQGYGSIFVVASGNGGSSGDNCNYDGYANSIYTVTIGAVDENGGIPYYAESCSSMLAVTFSSGDSFHKGIVTTDWQMGKGTGCTTGHSGTSAAAPLAAGMVALMLQVRPCLTWRDVQHIIVLTAKMINQYSSEWTVNAAGFYHSHQHGFGLMDAWRLVNAAKVWEPVSWLMSLNSPTLQENYVFTGGHTVKFLYNVSKEDADLHFLYSLEYVLVKVSISHSSRGNLELKLVCPSGTKSVIAAPRHKDKSKDGIKEWTFSTVRCWGSLLWASGNFSSLTMKAAAMPRTFEAGNPGEGWGKLENWKLTLYGSSLTPADIQARREMVEDAMDGRFLNSNHSAPCPPPEPPAYDETKAIRVKTLKKPTHLSRRLGVTQYDPGADRWLTVLLSLYYTVEQAFLNKEDKEGVPPPINPLRRGDTAEDIPMQTLTETVPDDTASTEEPVLSNDLADNSPELERQPLLSSQHDVQFQELPGTTTETSGGATSETYQNEMWSAIDEGALRVSCQEKQRSASDDAVVLELESSETDWEEQPLLVPGDTFVDEKNSDTTQLKDYTDKCVLPISEQTTVELMVGQEQSRTSGSLVDRSLESICSYGAVQDNIRVATYTAYGAGYITTPAWWLVERVLDVRPALTSLRRRTGCLANEATADLTSGGSECFISLLNTAAVACGGKVMATKDASTPASASGAAALESSTDTDEDDSPQHSCSLTATTTGNPGKRWGRRRHQGTSLCRPWKQSGTQRLNKNKPRTDARPFSEGAMLKTLTLEVRRCREACTCPVHNIQPSGAFWIECSGRESTSPEESCDRDTDPNSVPDAKTAFALEPTEEEQYREHLYGKQHWIYCASDGDIGPVVLALRPEQGHERETIRVQVRTSAQALAGLVPFSALCADRYDADRLATALGEEMGVTGLHSVNHPLAPEQLVRLDDELEKTDFKVGVLYVKEGQTTEEEIFANTCSSELFDEFLGNLGERVNLKGFDGYCGGLDRSGDLTGETSVYTEWRGLRLMFHVCTLLPHDPADSQQVQRKRHIGNDLVCVVFLAATRTSFNPSVIQSHFLHTYIVVQADPEQRPPQYKVSVVSRNEVSPYGPPLTERHIFSSDSTFREWLLTKIVNGERACYSSPKLASMRERTRRHLLEELVRDFSEQNEIMKQGNPLFGNRNRSTLLPDSVQQDVRKVDELSTDFATAFSANMAGVCDVTFIVADQVRCRSETLLPDVGYAYISGVLLAYSAT
ncbi:Proprotein convertase subtilisin/kexin type 7 [Branchiostoma belcheri]|nr:Proprotein convertase subtilisin/kexin type 7 [Branchiostoma belcheri]